MLQTCLRCGKAFKAPPSSERKYCGLVCYSFAERIAKREIRRCEHCGKNWSHIIGQSAGRFCSVPCYNNSRQIPVHKCETCGCVFKSGQRTKSNRFCSPACYWKSMKIDREQWLKNRREYTRKYRRTHPSWYRAIKQKRRALEKGAEGSFTAEEWNKLVEGCGGRCVMCRKKAKLTIDHIRPLSKGGSNYISNIQPLCMSCNSSKKDKDIV